MSVPILPDSAPFTPDQRAWLNGFFAGIAGSAQTNGGNAMPVSLAPSPGASASPAPAAPVEEEEFPWHDSTLSLDDRLALAKDKKPERQLMAAMAQLDCGSCGYVCQTYAEAIASGADKDLTKCSPGGKETATKLKELYVELNVASPATAQASSGSASASAAPSPATRAEGNGPSRDNPWAAPLIASRRLSSSDSDKEVRHVEFNLKGSALNYKAGDALGVWPENCVDDVTAIIERLGATGAEECHTIDGRDTSLFEALRTERVITKPTEALIELLIGCSSDPSERERLQGWLVQEHGEPLSNIDVLDVLMNASSARPKMSDFVGALSKLQPRLYSISSSPNAHPNQVHLTVSAVRWKGRLNQRTLRGVASTYLADRVRPGAKHRIFAHATKHFGLPPSGDTPIIMVGPGTGIAPFRAFLLDRKATGAPGKNWLFFGHQRSDCDFFYQEELNAMKTSGQLTRLSLAWSRDGEKKFYVQDRMREVGRELWTWLAEGAHLYICGDAKRMAKDVERALVDIVAQFGARSTDEAVSFVAELKKTGRFQADVY
jgi:sulfite reductase (NADPH) flavoprotein alpha-component